MVETIGQQVIVDAVLIVVMMAVLEWVESTRCHGGPVHLQRRERAVTRCPDPRRGDRRAQDEGRPAPGRKAA